MFISRDEADRRLTEKRNRLREAVQTEAPEILEQIDEKDFVRDPDEVREDAAREDEPEPQLDKDLRQLDALIKPKRNGRAHYVGDLAAQVAVGETEILLGPTAASALFDISSSQADAYSRGQRSSADITTLAPPKPALKKRIDEFKEILAKKAALRLGKTLDLLTDEKLGKVTKATELSQLSKDMAVVLEKVSPKDTGNEGGVHFHLYRPDMSQINQYEVIQVGPALQSE